jgi:hypothetical protein
VVYDIRPFVSVVQKILASHSLGEPGAYRRWNWQDADSKRDLGINPYACAGAANLLYTIGGFPREAEERRCWVETLQRLQDPETGLFREATHHEIHTTAQCIAALELFDVGPAHSLRALSELARVEEMERLLENLDWSGNPWTESHKGAGLYAALVLAGEVTGEWEDRYFEWLWEETDPATGLFRKGCVRTVRHDDVESIFPHIAGTFHYLFNHEYARRPIRYPRAISDTCLEVFDCKTYPLGKSVGFAEMDWLYALTRSMRQCGHRYDHYRSVLAAFADDYIPFLLALDPERDDGLNDLHALFGAVCCLAELQSALPGQIKTERPLRLVLDRRPFI